MSEAALVLRVHLVEGPRFTKPWPFGHWLPTVGAEVLLNIGGDPVEVVVTEVTFWEGDGASPTEIDIVCELATWTQELVDDMKAGGWTVEDE